MLRIVPAANHDHLRQCYFLMCDNMRHGGSKNRSQKAGRLYGWCRSIATALVSHAAGRLFWCRSNQAVLIIKTISLAAQYAARRARKVALHAVAHRSSRNKSRMTLVQRQILVLMHALSRLEPQLTQTITVKASSLTDMRQQNHVIAEKRHLAYRIGLPPSVDGSFLPRACSLRTLWFSLRAGPGYGWKRLHFAGKLFCKFIVSITN